MCHTSLGTPGPDASCPRGFLFDRPFSPNRMDSGVTFVHSESNTVEHRRDSASLACQLAGTDNSYCQVRCPAKEKVKTENVFAHHTNMASVALRVSIGEKLPVITTWKQRP